MIAGPGLLDPVAKKGLGLVGKVFIDLARNDRHTVLRCEGLKHPKGREVDAGIGIGGGDVTGIVLVEGPISVPFVPLLAWFVHCRRDEGDPHMGASATSRMRRSAK